MSVFKKLNFNAQTASKNGVLSLKNNDLNATIVDEKTLPANVNEIILESHKPVDFIVILRSKMPELKYVVKANTSGKIVLICETENVQVKRQLILEDDASITFVFPDFSSGDRIIDFETVLVGKNAVADWNLSTFSNNKEQKDFNISFSHYGHASNADMKNYGVLLDGGTLIFSGNSTIYEHVKGAETHQTARIIVFDPDGKAEANPNLNIYHNDVIAASHAATVGKVNDEHLYYLGSRGLDEFDAKKLITKGYLQPIIELIDDDTLKDKLLHDLEGIL
ncbi:MAG TPA: SufD family Fe-S cluster assembly protein [Bacilli bacterium]|nr:SufD family Fe-S cluster assembly protein [Bacilli bacterium]